MALELFRPCIDLHEGKVKQVVGSTLHDTGAVVENFVADKSPAHYAALFCNAGLTGGHVVMLGAGNQAACRDAAMIAGLGFHSLKANKALHPFEINTKQKSGERVGNDNFFNFSPNSQKVRMKGWL